MTGFVRPKYSNPCLTAPYFTRFGEAQIIFTGLFFIIKVSCNFRFRADFSFGF